MAEKYGEPIDFTYMLISKDSAVFLKYVWKMHQKCVENWIGDWKLQ